MTQNAFEYTDSISVFKKIHVLYGNDDAGKLEWGVSKHSRMAQFVDHLHQGSPGFLTRTQKMETGGLEVQGHPQLYS